MEVSPSVQLLEPQEHKKLQGNESKTGMYYSRSRQPKLGKGAYRHDRASSATSISRFYVDDYHLNTITHKGETCRPGANIWDKK
jgi:hypothetical protein